MADNITIDELVNQVISKYDMRNEHIAALKKKIRPHSTVSEIREIINNMILEDIDYVRKYLADTSNIAFQQDFPIKKKQNWIYRADFNNDSADLNLHDGKVMLAYKDYTLNSHNFDFYIEVFINGRRLNKYDFFERPSDKEYNFITGGRRLFIKEELVSDGDLISVVVRKFRKMKTYYKYFKIVNDRQNTYKFTELEVGPYGENTSNLMVFRKIANSNSFIPVDMDDYYFDAEDKEINITFTFDNIKKLKRNDYFLIMNKTRNHEVIFTNKSNLTEAEYIENSAVMTLDAVLSETVNGANVPIPVRSIEELEVYVDGYRLVCNKDYTFTNDEENFNQRIQFAGILKQGSVVVMRNKNINKFGFYNYVSPIEEPGIIDLGKYHIPIFQNYVESYLGRRRVPLSCKRNIINLYLKNDSQHSLLWNECYTEINNDEYTNELLHKYEIDNIIYGQLQNLFPDETMEAWLDHNPLLPNDGNLDEDYLDNEIFLGKINRIQLIADPTIITEGRDTEFTVIGYYGEHEIGLDITNLCTITGFNPFKLGVQVIKASFKQGGQVLNDTIKIEVIPKEIIEIKIITDSNFYVVGDTVLDTIRVLARYEDNSTKYITEDCTIAAPEYAAEAGSLIVNVEYNYNRQQLRASKVLLVSETTDRIIIHLETLTSTVSTSDGTYATKLEFFATFNNNLVQKLSPETLTVSVVDSQGNKEVIRNIENVILSLDENITLNIEAYTTNAKDNIIYFIDEEGNAAESYTTTIKILNHALRDQNKIVIFEDLTCHLNPEYTRTDNAAKYRIKDYESGSYITIGLENIGNESICFATMENNQYVIVEFYTEEEEFIEEVLFIAQNATLTRGIISGSISGTPFNGFTVKINQFVLGMNLEDINLDSVNIIDKDAAIIASFNKDDVDAVSQSENSIYFGFNNYSTMNGNVKQIADYILNHSNEEDFVLYLDIINSPNLVKLEVNPFTFNVIEPTNIFFDRRTDDYFLTIVFNQLADRVIESKYEVRPYNNSLINVTQSDSPVPTSTIKLPTNVLNYILVNEGRYGLNRWFIKTTEGNTYIVDVTLELKDGRVILTKVNDTEYTEAQYDSFEIVKV